MSFICRAERIQAQLLDVINYCFLYQHVKDLIFTKEKEDVGNIEVLQPLGQYSS